MPLIVYIMVFLCGGFASAAVLVGLLSLRRGGDRALIANACMSIGLAAFAGVLSRLLQEHDVARMDQLVRWASLFLFVSQAFCVWFFGLLLFGKLPRRYLLSGLACLGLAGFGASSPGGVRQHHIHEVLVRVAPWGDLISEPSGPVDQGGTAFLYLISGSVCLMPFVDALRIRAPLAARVAVGMSAGFFLLVLVWDLLHHLGWRSGTSTAIFAYPVVFLSLAVWITARERRLAEDLRRAYGELSEHHERLRAIMDSSIQLISLVDPQGRVLMANRATLHAIDAHAQDVVGMSLAEFPWFRYDAAISERARAALTGAASGSFERFRTVYRDQRGETRQLDVSLSPFQGPGGGVRFLVHEARDITDLLTLEEQQRQTQKLHALGQLAGGIAHDFNNLLAGILGSAEMLSLRIDGEPRSQRLVQIILDAGQRAKELTSQLLSYSRRGRKASEPVDLHELTAATIALVERTFDPSIRIVCSLQATHPIVIGDRAQLEAALLNLCVNARDAMPRGGELRVATDGVKLPSENPGPDARSLSPGDYLRLRVSDTGAGMSPEVQRHLFEPFFTTKPKGKGTGLGLASTYGALVEHHGRISVQSEEGNGSTFEILLPRAPASIEVARAEIAFPAQAMPRQRVLVVDDRQTIREVLGSVLQALGYEIDVMSRGNDALAHFRGGGAPYACVVLDMAMPDMSGGECFRALHALVPDLPVVMCSGFVQEETLAALRRDGLAGFVAKPFSSAELAGAIEHAIHNAPVAC